MTKIFKEPLLYFLLLGGAMFLFFQQVSDDALSGTDQREEIVVTEGRIQTLLLGFEKVWQRSPTQEELDGLIQDHIREEVLYREALIMGLDRDDTIVRRRLRQKIEFISEDLVNLEEPEDEELQAFLVENAERFRQPSRFSFQQVYLNASQRGPSVNADAQSVLTELRKQDSDASRAGDQLMIPSRFENTSEREVARILGNQFLAGLQEANVGSWQGPIASGFGLHLVYISKRIESTAPALAEVHDAVLQEWNAVKRKQANEAFYKALRARYTVTVASPKRVGAPQISMVETLK